MWGRAARERLPVHHTLGDEGPAFGAALLAGVAGGAYSDVLDACSVIRLDPQVELPNAGRHRTYLRYHAAFAELYAATGRTMHRLGELSTERAED